MLARKARESSSAMRVRQAMARPNRRARGRCSGGSLLTAIEMKTRLSMPSTISSVARVSSAIQISVLKIQSIVQGPGQR